MPNRILDKSLMSKLARKLGKKNIYDVNKIVSNRASKLGISAEAALVLLAKEHKFGTSLYQRKLDDAKQAQIRGALPANFEFLRTRPVTSSHAVRESRPTVSKRVALRSAIEYLIEDPELRSRCQDILMASANFDRPINQATLVLEDRIRRKAQPTKKLVGDGLVGFAFNEEISKTVLRVASNDDDDQRGFTQILRGVVPAFRNKTHHHVITTFSREDAMRVCGFIDVLIRLVDNCVKVK